MGRQTDAHSLIDVEFCCILLSPKNIFRYVILMDKSFINTHMVMRPFNLITFLVQVDEILLDKSILAPHLLYSNSHNIGFDAKSNLIFQIWTTIEISWFSNGILQIKNGKLQRNWNYLDPIPIFSKNIQTLIKHRYFTK